MNFSTIACGGKTHKLLLHNKTKKKKSTLNHRRLEKYSKMPTDTRHLSLFDWYSSAQNQPRLALCVKLAKRSHHGRNGDFYQIFCNFNHRQFGGLYSKLESERILDDFKHYTGPVSPAEFGRVAERVIAATHKRGVA